MEVSFNWLDYRAFTSKISRSSFSFAVVILKVSVGVRAFFPCCRCCGSGGGGGGGGGVRNLNVGMVAAAVVVVLRI